MNWLLLYELIIGHALADFVLQNEAMGSGKNRHSPIHQAHGKHFPSWYYWLGAHALIHGGVVYLITGSWILGLIETAIHAVVDFSKCEDWIGFHVDQGLHVLCKIVYCIALSYYAF